MKETYFDHSTKAGIAGGTLLSILLNLQYSQLFETAALAAVGAAASFGMTFFLKFIIKKWRRSR